MDKNKEKQLLELLTEWFNDVDLDKDNFFNKNRVAILIKDRIDASGRWKRQGVKGSAKHLKGFRF